MEQASKRTVSKFYPLRGEGLAAKDIITSDPFCKFGYIDAQGEYVGNLRETDVIKMTLNPVWRKETEVFSDFSCLPLLELTGNDKIVGVRIEVFDWNKLTSPAFMGQAELHFSSLQPSTSPQYIPLELKQKPGKTTTVKGKIVVGLLFSSDAVNQAQKEAALAETRAREEEAKKAEEVIVKLVEEYGLAGHPAPAWMAKSLTRAWMTRNLGNAVSDASQLLELLGETSVFDKVICFHPFSLERRMERIPLMVCGDDISIRKTLHRKFQPKFFKEALSRWIWFLFDVHGAGSISARQLLDLIYLHHSKEPQEVCEEYFRLWSAGAPLLSRDKINQIFLEFFKFQLNVYGFSQICTYKEFFTSEPFGPLAKCVDDLKAIYADGEKTEYIVKVVKVMLFFASGKVSSDGMMGLTLAQFTSVLTSDEAVSMIWSNTHFGLAGDLVNAWVKQVPAACK
eukprot:TRINITY_DN1276_c0_g1_i2.p2 TRINITY_DN1276_c0_g1~~TRINITY_DN1276_c0_g1_i2.p2  ORF type:complete len:453 (+),score=111.79 TRINITY_DN1276_c0_g1_i2:2670-4028(+)